MAYTLQNKTEEYLDAGFNIEWLNANEQVARIVDKYIDSVDTGAAWSPERLRQELETTSWWRDLSEAQREWEVLSAEQPGEANLRISDNRRTAQQLGMLMGVQLSDSQLDALARKAAENGWSEDDFRLAIAKEFKPTSGIQAQGDAQNTMAQIRSMAEQYLVRPSDSLVNEWTMQVLRGDRAIEDLRTYFIDRAASMYKGVADDLRAGATTREILDPYLADAYEELGVTEANINLFDAKWSAPLTGENNEPLTREQWIAQIRSDSRYGWDQTWKARNAAAEMGRELQTLFGG